MNDSNIKCVMVIDSELPIGVISNTSAILGITLGKHIPEQIGDNVMDATNKTHLGIITIPVAMLRGDAIYGNKNKINKLTGSMPLL